MIEKNKITFIVPSLNRPTLNKAIQSLLDQTNPNWKCIVIYDGVEGNEFEDERITTITIDRTGRISQHHGESGLVRNYGIKQVTTEWIGFLDDDDTLHKDYVAKTLNKYKDFDVIIFRMQTENKRVFPAFHDESIVHGNVGISFCYKKELGEILFQENRDGEDLDFINQLLQITKNYIVTTEICYNIRH